MADHNYRRWSQERLRQQAQAAARAIIAQGRQAGSARRQEPQRLSTPPLEAEEEPMNRYIHVITRQAERCSCSCPASAEDTALLERMLETLTEQNQLLVDLLGAVNALTAATLGVQARLSGPRD